MDEFAFEKKLDELVSEIRSVPKSNQSKLIKLVRQTKQSHKDLKKSLDSLQDSIDYLRVTIKYLLFDLEATRRENDYLKKMLDEKSE